MMGEKKSQNNSSVVIDPESWVDQYGDYLFRYALRYVRNESLAEELVQETLLAALKKKDSFEGKSNVRTWLTSILKHKIIDDFRKRSRSSSLPEEEVERAHNAGYFNAEGHWGDTKGTPWSADPDKVLEQKEFLQALEECLAKLPERVRHLFLLREVEGHRRKDLSNKLGITATNIGVLLHRARLDLRECLTRNWIEADR